MRLYKTIFSPPILISPEDEARINEIFGERFLGYRDIYFYNNEKCASALGGNVALGFDDDNKDKASLMAGYKVDEGLINSLFTEKGYDSIKLQKVAQELKDKPKLPTNVVISNMIEIDKKTKTITTSRGTQLTIGMRLHKTIFSSPVFISAEDEAQVREILGEKFEEFNEIYFYNNEKWAPAAGGNLGFQMNKDSQDTKLLLMVSFEVDRDLINSLFTEKSYDSGNLLRIAQELKNNPIQTRPILPIDKTTPEAFEQNMLHMLDRMSQSSNANMDGTNPLINLLKNDIVDSIKKLLQTELDVKDIELADNPPNEDYYMYFQQGDLGFAKGQFKSPHPASFIKFVCANKDSLNQKVKDQYFVLSKKFRDNEIMKGIKFTLNVPDLREDEVVFIDNPLQKYYLSVTGRKIEVASKKLVEKEDLVIEGKIVEFIGSRKEELDKKVKSLFKSTYLPTRLAEHTFYKPSYKSSQDYNATPNLSAAFKRLKSNSNNNNNDQSEEKNPVNKFN